MHRSARTALTLTAEGETFLGVLPAHDTGTLDDLEGEFASQSGEASRRGCAWRPAP
jgi:hypothetical protein